MGAVRAVRLGSPSAATASGRSRTSRSRLFGSHPFLATGFVIRFGKERIVRSLPKHRSQLPSSLSPRRGGRSSLAKGSPAATAHNQTACRWVHCLPARRTLSLGKNATLLPAGSNRSERLEKSTRWRREDRQGLAICPLAPAIHAFTQSASPIQLYFPPPNPAIGIAAPVPKMPQNLQKIRLHQFRGFAAI